MIQIKKDCLIMITFSLHSCLCLFGQRYGQLYQRRGFTGGGWFSTGALILLADPTTFENVTQPESQQNCAAGETGDVCNIAARHAK